MISDSSKLVSRLGTHFPVPVEVVPFALGPVRRQLEQSGAHVDVRLHESQLYVSYTTLYGSASHLSGTHWTKSGRNIVNIGWREHI